MHLSNVSISISSTFPFASCFPLSVVCLGHFLYFQFPNQHIHLPIFDSNSNILRNIETFKTHNNIRILEMKMIVFNIFIFCYLGCSVFFGYLLIIYLDLSLQGFWLTYLIQEIATFIILAVIFCYKYEDKIDEAIIRFV